MKNEELTRTCPKCGCEYIGRPALSRRDNETEICPDCGTREALEDTFGASEETQNRILAAIHKANMAAKERAEGRR